MRQARLRIGLAAQQDRPALDDELQDEVGRKLPWAERRITLDCLPALLESVEALELVARRLEQDSVVAALELGLLLQERDGVTETSAFALELTVLAKEPYGECRDDRQDPDDDDDDQDLDQRHAAHQAARTGDVHRLSPSGRHSRFQLPISASASSPSGSPSAPREYRS